MSFGGFLIKQVADDLARELPNIKTFATLSPIPGFRSWLRGRLEGDGRSLVSEPEAQQLTALAGDAHGGHAALARLLGGAHWWCRASLVAVLEPLLMRLCARYLLRERPGKRARDRVAHFHLTNGARVERINWLADTSERGIELSAGMMVNYRYQLNDIERNHEAYSADGKVAASTAVKKLLKR